MNNNREISNDETAARLNTSSKRPCNIEVKFDHINNSILVLKDNQSIIKLYNPKKSGNIFSDLDKILYLLDS